MRRVSSSFLVFVAVVAGFLIGCGGSGAGGLALDALSGPPETTSSPTATHAVVATTPAGWIVEYPRSFLVENPDCPGMLPYFVPEDSFAEIDATIRLAAELGHPVRPERIVLVREPPTFEGVKVSGVAVEGTFVLWWTFGAAPAFPYALPDAIVHASTGMPASSRDAFSLEANALHDALRTIILYPHEDLGGDAEAGRETHSY